MTRWLILLLAVSVISSVPGPSSQASADSTLKQRFERRYPTLVRLKNVGKVGESFTGFVDVVDKKFLSETVGGAAEGQTIGKFIDLENSDRKTLYIQVAQKTSSSADQVAKRNAKRVFQKALAHHYLKLRSGKWVQKKDLK